MKKIFPICKPVPLLKIGIALLENDNVYPEYRSQYASLISQLGYLYSFIEVPYFSKDYIHELDEFQAIIISGGKGHVDERDDINYFFKALQKYMKTHQVVGFCMAYQYQLKMLDYGITGDFGRFKRYIATHKSYIDGYPDIELYMAHRYYFKGAITHEDVFPFLQTSEISCAAFIYKNKGLFFQAHPECSLSHVSQNISLVKDKFIKGQYFIQQLVKRFILNGISSISPFIATSKSF